MFHCKMHLWKNLGLITPIFQNWPNFKVWTLFRVFSSVEERELGIPQKCWFFNFHADFDHFVLIISQPVDSIWKNLLSQKNPLDSSLFSNFSYTDQRRLCDEYEFTTDTEDDSLTQNIPNHKKSEQSNKPCKFYKSLIMLLCNKVWAFKKR